MLFVRRPSFLYQSRKGIPDGISNQVEQILTLARDVTPQVHIPDPSRDDTGVWRPFESEKGGWRGVRGGEEKERLLARFPKPDFHFGQE